VFTLKQFFVYLLLSLPFIGAYAMLGSGIVVVFRASRVLNLAHGAMAMLPAYVVYSLNQQHGVPMVVAVPLGVASGGLLGMLVERFFVRPLSRQGTTAQTVGTIAVFGVVVAGVAQLFGSGSRAAPRVFPAGGITVAGSRLLWGQIGLFVVALVCAAGFVLLFKYTRVGLAMRGAAENPTAAGLMGVNPLAMARLAWALGGCLAGLTGVLLAAVTSLNPYSLSLQMLPAFVAALIGGLASLPGALVGALIVGAAQGMVPAFALIPGLRTIASQVGLPQLVLTLLALAVMYVRGQRFSIAERASAIGQVSTEVAPRSAYDARLTAPRRGWPRLLKYGVLAALLAWPFAHFPGFLPVDRYSALGDATLAAEYFLVAASLVMLTGWVGQISLAQGSLVGIGAFGSALVARHIGLPFPTGILVAGLVSAAVAALVGVVALRVRGLYLAVATLIVAWMADEYLFVVPWFAGTGGSATLNVKSAGHEHAFPFFDFTDRRTFYFVMLAAAGMVFFALLNLRDSKTGRAFAAVRGSEMAAASLGINVVRTKLFAFCFAGLIAGIGGNLILTNQQTVTPDQFGLQGNQGSLILLAIAVVGGLRSLGGAIGAGVVFAALNELVFRVPSVGRYLQLVSALLLALILLFYPGGLAAVPADVRRLWRRLTGRRPQATAEAVTPAETDEEQAAPASPVVDITRRIAVRDAALTGPVLRADNITVRFGGLVAVKNASLEVRAGQIVGLIGPNGAGKTTLFNSISGLNSPTSGTVEMYGEDVTDLAVHERAARGLGRTFQVIQLFPELTVFENLLVATHLHNKTGPLAHIAASAGAIRAELDAENTCREIVRFLELTDIADRAVAGLPFGTLRMVELGRALVTGAPIVMLDEPASGLDNTETDRLSEVLLRVRDQMSLSILLIEHDVRMVTAASDYMYVLDRGQLIAQGTPAEVQRDPAVVTAYLGEPVAEAVS